MFGREKSPRYNNKVERRKSSHLGKKHIFLFDPNQYTLEFDSIYKSKEVKDLFYEFLEAEHCPEQMDFLMEYQKLSNEITTKNTKEQIQVTLDLYTTFIANGSKKEINLSEKDKNEIASLVEKLKQSQNTWNIKETPQEIFFQAKEVVVHGLQYDNFKRFSKTEKAQKMLTEKFMDAEIITPKITKLFQYSDEDFKDPIITKKDFDFCKQLCKDGLHWEVVGKKFEKNFTVSSFWSNENYFPEMEFFQKNPFSCAKYETVFPCSIEQLVSTFQIENLKKLDNSIKHILCKKFVQGDENNKDMAFMEFVVNLPMLQPRILQCVISATYLKENNTYILIGKPYKTSWEWLKPSKYPVPSKDGKPVEKECFNIFDFLFYVIEKVDDQHTSYKQIHLINLAGWATSPIIFKKLVHDRCVKIRENILKILENLPKDFKMKDLDVKDDPYVTINSKLNF